METSKCLDRNGSVFNKCPYSAEDGIGGTIGLFRRNSGCSVEQKTLGIPFWTVPQGRKMLGILCHGTKIEATLVILFQTIPRKRKQLGIPFRRTKIEIISRNSVPKLSRMKHCGCWSRIFCKIYFFHPISIFSEPRNWLFRKTRNAS